MSETAGVTITHDELMHVPGVSESAYRDATWFSDVWAAHCRPGLHLRAIHYTLVSKGTVLMAPGVRSHAGERGRPAPDPALDAICLPYENTRFCWDVLLRSAIAARHWRLVDARSFAEHRSPEPIVTVETRDPPTPAVVVPAAWPIDGRFVAPLITGYEYVGTDDQPVALEVWCEKSTMDDVLVPLCQALRVNYQPLTGYFSITRAVELLCRCQKPTIVLYISDLDPAGVNMPIAFAEALAHYRPIYAPNLEIRLKPIALTEQQAVAYGLPRNVIDKDKESSYNRRFRDEHPDGPVELDALEAVRPGELARLVRTTVEPFVDKTLVWRLHAAGREAEQLVSAKWHEQTAQARAELDRIDKARAEIQGRLADALAPHEKVIADIRAKFNEEFSPLDAERDGVRQGILNQTIEVDLPPRPEPEVPIADDGWLFVAGGASR